MKNNTKKLFLILFIVAFAACLFVIPNNAYAKTQIDVINVKNIRNDSDMIQYGIQADSYSFTTTTTTEGVNIYYQSWEHESGTPKIVYYESANEYYNFAEGNTYYSIAFQISDEDNYEFADSVKLAIDGEKTNIVGTLKDNVLVFDKVSTIYIKPWEEKTEYNDLGALNLSIDISNGKSYEMSLDSKLADYLGFAGWIESLQYQSNPKYVFFYSVNEKGQLQIQEEDWWPITEANSESLFKVEKVNDTTYALSAVKSSDKEEKFVDTNNIEKMVSFDIDEANRIKNIVYDRYSPVSVSITYGTVANEKDESEPSTEKQEETTTGTSSETSAEPTNPETTNVETQKNAIIESENAVAEKQVNILIEKIKNNEQVEGIDSELSKEIINAINEGKEVKVEVAQPQVNREAVAEDASKVEKFISKGEKVAAYFDIDILVKINGEQKGNVTKLNEPITITVPIPTDLPAVASGYNRTYKIVRVHDGVAKELKAKVDNGNISFDTDSFSTYAITYEDKKITKSPKTGDNVLVYAGLFAVSLAGVVMIRRKK